MFEPLFAELRDRDQQFIVHRADEQTEIKDWFKSHDVPITHRKLPEEAPEPFAVIKTNDEFVGAISLKALQVLLEPPIIRPVERDNILDIKCAVFDVLDNTMVHGMTRRELLAVAREIEYRAYQAGAGTIHVNFRTLSTLQSQIAVYRQLAASTHLNVHIHGADEWAPVDIVGLAYHTGRPEELDSYWALTFDGGDDETQACGLVAEHNSDEFDGFWTNDPEIVENITSILTENR